MGLAFNTMKISVNERDRFVFEGWYSYDLEGEVEYWKDACDNPVEYETDEETAMEELKRYEELLRRFDIAFEEQRNDKVDYDDGTWV